MSADAAVVPLQAWVAARVVLVQCPDNPANPNGVLTPADGFAAVLLAEHPTLRSVEGPYVNGLVALTWENDPAPNVELVARSAAGVHAAVERDEAERAL